MPHVRPTDAECVFCKIVASKIPCFKLFESDTNLAFMDINPINPGHALAIPKGHWPDLYEVPEPALKDTIALARRIAIAVHEVLRPAGLNLLQANGPGAAQSVPHFHLHVVPRRMGDNANFNWTPQPGDPAEIGKLAERIRAKLT
jgi:histidine triad (HIT) family protein